MASSSSYSQEEIFPFSDQGFLLLRHTFIPTFVALWKICITYFQNMQLLAALSDCSNTYSPDFSKTQIKDRGRILDFQCYKNTLRIFLSSEFLKLYLPLGTIFHTRRFCTDPI